MVRRTRAKRSRSAGISPDATAAPPWRGRCLATRRRRRSRRKSGVVARSATLDRNRWTPEQPLARGRAYAWQVRVIRGAGVETLPPPPRPNPRFRVIGDYEARDLAEARTSYPNDHLLLGVLAAHH